MSPQLLAEKLDVLLQVSYIPLHPSRPSVQHVLIDLNFQVLLVWALYCVYQWWRGLAVYIAWAQDALLKGT